MVGCFVDSNKKPVNLSDFKLIEQYNDRNAFDNKSDDINFFYEIETQLDFLYDMISSLRTTKESEPFPKRQYLLQLLLMNRDIEDSQFTINDPVTFISCFNEFYRNRAVDNEGSLTKFGLNTRNSDKGKMKLVYNEIKKEFLKGLYKDEYLKAVRTGNKQQQNKLLKDQELRSTSLQAWKTASESSKELYDDNLYAKNSLTAEQKNMLAQIHDQSNAKIRMNDQTGEMEFTITGLDGGSQNVTLREFQKLMETSVMPEKLRLELQQEDQQITNYALQGGAWDEKQQETAMANNKRRINKDKIRTYFYEDITGTNSTFAKDILAHKDFEGVDLDELGFGMDAKFKGADTDEDGTLTTEEFKAAGLTMEDRELIVEEMLKPENFDIAQTYLADYMTRKQKQSYDRGVKMRSTVPKNKNVG